MLLLLSWCGFKQVTLCFPVTFHCWNRNKNISFLYRHINKNMHVDKKLLWHWMMSQTFQLIKGEFAFFFSFQLMFNSSVVSNRVFVKWDNGLGTRDLEEQPKVHVLSLNSHTQYFTEAWPRKSDWYEQRENWFSEVLSCLWGKHYLFWTLNLQEALTWHGIYLPELTWQLAGSWGMFRFPSAWAAA